MIRLLNTYFPRRTLFLGITEACLVSLAFIAATVARLGTSDASFILHYPSAPLKIAVLSMVVILCMYYFNLYDSAVLGNRREILIRLIPALLTVYAVLAVIYYLYPPLQLGRGIFAIGLTFVALLLLLGREVFMMINRKPGFASRVLILGDSSLGESLVEELQERSELGLRVVGHVKTLEQRNERRRTASSDENIEALMRSVEFYQPDHIVVALGDRRGYLPVEALLQLKGRGIGIHDGTQLYEAVTGKVAIESLYLSYLLFSPHFRISRHMALYRRAISFVLSLIAIILTAPLMALIGLAVLIDSGRPIIFKQERLGQDGKIFTLRKFRTMVVSNEQTDTTRPPEADDKRFTRVGKFIRRTRMDELPQLINILLGDMHFIGPRPFVPVQEQECLEYIPHYRQRWAVKPGVTGWAQINLGYNVTLDDNKEKLAYDLFYIKNQSVGLDLLIVFKTMKVLLLGQGSR